MYVNERVSSEVCHSPPTLNGAGHQFTVSIDVGYVQWLSLAKPTLKVAPAGRNHSSVACNTKCGLAILKGMFTQKPLGHTWLLRTLNSNYWRCHIPSL